MCLSVQRIVQNLLTDMCPELYKLMACVHELQTVNNLISLTARVSVQRIVQNLPTDMCPELCTICPELYELMACVHELQPPPLTISSR